jgi:hypothetical protein
MEMKARRPISNTKIAAIINQRPEPGLLKILTFEVLKDAPMLDNRGEEAKMPREKKLKTKISVRVPGLGIVQLLPGYPGTWRCQIRS